MGLNDNLNDVELEMLEEVKDAYRYAYKEALKYGHKYAIIYHNRLGDFIYSLVEDTEALGKWMSTWSGGWCDVMDCTDEEAVMKKIEAIKLYEE